MKFNQKGFSDVIIVSVITGIIGALFIAGVFIWQEIDKENALNDLDGKLSKVVKVDKEIEDFIPIYEKVITGYELAIRGCRFDDCLFIKGNEALGVTKLVGYYTNYLKKGSEWDQDNDDWKDVEKHCDALTVTGGDQRLIDSIFPWAEKGTFGYSSNDLNQPIVNFYLGDLRDDDKNKILDSTEDNPVEIIALRTFHEGGPPATCFTQMNILDVR